MYMLKTTSQTKKGEEWGGGWEGGIQKKKIINALKFTLFCQTTNDGHMSEHSSMEVIYKYVCP